MNNESVAWTACLDCGKRVTGDSIHTCSPQLKTLTETEDTECQYCKQGCIRCDARKLLTDEEIDSIGDEVSNLIDTYAGRREFARAILKKAQEK
jgi:DNA-directed RNA polymerase subunit RPC12/RpoP